MVACATRRHEATVSGMFRRITHEARIWAGAIAWLGIRVSKRYATWFRADRVRGTINTSVAAVVVLLALMTGGSDQTGPSSSRYISWMTNDLEQDTETARRTACLETGDGGVVLIAFGRQVAGGTRSFDGADVLYSYEHIGAVALAYADALSRCSDNSWTLVVATSNYKLNDPALASVHGAAWGSMIDATDDKAPGGVRLVGGIDLEPGWGAPNAAKAWIEAYKSVGVRLISNASADGCPQAGKGGRCANNWDVQLLAELVWGNGDHAALPQIYRHDGAQARQWGVLSRHWRSTGGTPRFVGVMTQVRACELVRNRHCPQLSLAPDSARLQLQEVVGEDIPVPHATDVGWG